MTKRQKNFFNQKHEDKCFIEAQTLKWELRNLGNKIIIKNKDK